MSRIEEESVDLTPGVVWTDAQLAVVRDLMVRATHAEAAVQRVRLWADLLDDDMRALGYADGHTMTPMLRAVLDGTP